MWRREFWCESEGLGIVWADSPFTLVVFSTDDCATDDCEAIEPSPINLAMRTPTDGCAIHDTRIGVSISIRLHGDLIMCDVFRKVSGRLLWVGRMSEADAMARVCRHRDEVYVYGDIPF